MEKRIITGFAPDKLFDCFEQIARIPHGSGNEAALAAYIEKFAAERGCEAKRDASNNVFVRVPATAGREKESPVLLQGHLDMVCEKNAATEHDFEKDPLDLYVEDGWLHARGTTLGGDDGIAVAVMMAMIDGECKSHPELECLFTTDEEVGLIGATNFDYSVVRSKKMINMDSENEGSVVVGCAGGLRSDLSLKYKTQPFRGEALKIALTGLCGGHSGAEINCGRQNANKLLGRILLNLSGKMRVNLISLAGGSKDNAIPREAFCTVSVANADRAARAVLREVERIREELVEADAGLVVTCSVTAEPAEMMDTASTRRALAVVGTAQNGVIAMSRDIPGLVGFSRNLGVVRTDCDTKTVDFVFSSRSPIESQLDASVDSLDALAAVCGCTARHYSRYPGWNYATRSPLRDKFVTVARELYGKEPVVEVIHAGLECGIIRSHLPKLDVISIGPAMRAIHSPDEALNLASCEKFWTLVCRLLA